MTASNPAATRYCTPGRQRGFERSGHPCSLAPQILGDLARVIGLRRCEDAAFRKLCERLRGWFPAGGFTGA